MHKEPDELLIEILKCPRPDWVARGEVTKWLIEKIESYHAGQYCPPRVLAGRNVVVELGDANGEMTTLFSCHLDTVDALLTDAVQATKVLTYDVNFGHIHLQRGSPHTCLGADDGAGMWLMLKMIERGVPGAYVFHTGEEMGGIGSKAMANEVAPWLCQFDRCIAFDRQGTDEVITHQGGAPCASATAGQWLASQLNAHIPDGAYRRSQNGVFTDNRNYRDFIPECINISVGYEWQHSQAEYLDWGHLDALREACLQIKWGDMPTGRELGGYVTSVGAQVLQRAGSLTGQLRRARALARKIDKAAAEQPPQIDAVRGLSKALIEVTQESAS